MSEIIEAERQTGPQCARSERLQATLLGFQHQEVSSLALGVILVPLYLLHIAQTEHQTSLVIIATILLVAGGVRIAATLLYRKFGRPTSPQKIKFWKSFTITTVLAYSTMLGLFAYVAIVGTDNFHLHLVSIAIVSAYAGATVGRNAALQDGIAGQLITTVLLVAIALAQKDDYVYRTLSVLVILYLFSLGSISRSVFNLIVSIFQSSEEKESLLQAITEKSERFDAALSNMPHGLAMVDADCRVVVANDKFCEMLKLSSIQDNSPIKALFEISVRSEVLPPEAVSRLDRKVRDSANNQAQTEAEITTVDDRTLELVIQPKARGGCVIIVMDVTEKKAIDRITHLAHHDKLTGLPNRRYFDERFASTLDAAKRSNGRLAVMALDLDHFKAVNDTLGHLVGDELLKAASKRIRSLLRPEDFASRFGGDEFMLIHHAGNDRDGATHLARRIIDAVGAPYKIANNEIVIGLTVGIAHFPDDGSEQTELLHNADLALYQAKREHRSTFRQFEPLMESEARERRQLEVDLRKALEQEQFQLAYQPIVDIATNSIAGCEALLRWRHPAKGLVPAARFIPVAEETGMVRDIDRWVLEKACRDAALWPSGKTVSVNLSANQFRRHDLVAMVRDTLSASGLPANQLELEITEATMVGGGDSVRDVLAELRKLGVSINLDDFGASRSSFDSLIGYPIDKVKLDRSIIAATTTSHEKRAVVRTIAALADELRITLVAEGVETADELKIVQSNPIQRVQGFFFSEPLPAHQIPWEGALKSAELGKRRIA